MTKTQSIFITSHKNLARWKGVQQQNHVINIRVRTKILMCQLQMKPKHLNKHPWWMSPHHAMKTKHFHKWKMFLCAMKIKHINKNRCKWCFSPTMGTGHWEYGTFYHNSQRQARQKESSKDMFYVRHIGHDTFKCQYKSNDKYISTWYRCFKFDVIGVSLWKSANERFRWVDFGTQKNSTRKK